MRLIVTHEQPDFDALASIALAKLLYPGSQATVQGGIGTAQTALLRLYRDVLDLLAAEKIDLGDVTELVVVDTADPARIRPFDQLIGRVPITLYDHHPLPDDPIPAGRGLVERVGATATLLTRELAASTTRIPPAVASLGLLGIHEDTGNLSYDMTTPDDHRAAAYLLNNGANLQLVRRYAHDTLGDEQVAFRSALHANSRTIKIAGRDVVLATFDYPEYVSGVSGLISDLLEISAVDAALVAVRMDGKTLVFARSNERFDSAAALAEAIDGAGHPGAAFGKTDLDPEQAAHLVLESLARYASPVVLAADVMTSPVKTIRDHATVAETQAALLLHGHNGMPVIDQHGDVVGIISRRDIDRALRHGLGRSRASGFMSRAVVTAAPDTPIHELEELVLEHNIGRIPIVANHELLGIVTRADLIQARHRPKLDAGEVSELLARLPPRAASTLRTTSELAGEAPLYLVGGTVRDLLIGAGSKDIDIVVEGESAERLATRLQQHLGGTLSCHVDFGTCTLALDDGPIIDIATAREEVYAHPGALPEVTPSSLKQDLARRDFTINAMAIRLQPEPRHVIDPYRGKDDLERKLLRVLHPLSFVEDPTRLLRGARLAGRLAFDFATDTRRKATAALQEEVVGRVSHARLRAELELTLGEQRVAPALALLEDLGAMQVMFGLPLTDTASGTDVPAGDGRANDASANEPSANDGSDGLPSTAGALDLVAALDEIRREATVPDETYLLALLLSAAEDLASRHIELFNWPRRLLQSLARLRRLLQPGAEASDDELEQLSDAERTLVLAADQQLAARIVRLQELPARRRLRGRDVVALGLPEGPAIGDVLAEVAKARAERSTTTFDEELDLARRLVARLRTPQGTPE